MFEVGKSYRLKTPTGDASLVDCVYKHGHEYVLRNLLGSLLIRYSGDFSKYDEYKEPLKAVQHINFYKDSGFPDGIRISYGHADRKTADHNAGADRIGCIRVTLTEGQYDD